MYAFAFLLSTSITCGCIYNQNGSMLDALNRFFISLLIVSQQSAGLYKLILDIFASVHNADILRETALLLSLFVYAFMQ